MHKPWKRLLVTKEKFEKFDKHLKNWKLQNLLKVFKFRDINLFKTIIVSLKTVQYSICKTT